MGDKNVHILVVDDEKGIRDLLSYELSQRGYTVTTAEHGPEAIKLIKHEKFHLVISDIRMPKMDGTVLLEEIKLADPNVEVILMTAYGTVESAVAAMKKGAYDFIRKPFKLDEMIGLVERALEKRELRTLVALHEASRTIFSTIEFEELTDVVMALMNKVLRPSEGSLILLDAHHQAYLASGRGLQDVAIREKHLELGKTWLELPDEQRIEQMVQLDSEQLPEFLKSESKERLISVILLPLVVQRNRLGVLILNRRVDKPRFSDTDFHHASIFAAQISQALWNAQLHKSLQDRLEELRKAYQTVKETQDKLVQSEKMASIGRMVAGLSHEISASLIVVLRHSQLLLETDVSAPIRQKVELIAKRTEHANKILRNLLTFVRPRKKISEKVNVCTLLDELVELLGPEFAEHEIQIEKNFPQDQPTIDGDSDLLHEAFMNILSNALHALEDAGSRKKITLSASVSDNIWQLVFTDNGAGIPNSNIDKIFEPFFTTKEVGKGTGLGLSIVYGILNQHHGAVDIQSSCDKGTTVTILLPLNRASAARLEKLQERPSESTPKQE